MTKKTYADKNGRNASTSKKKPAPKKDWGVEFVNIPLRADDKEKLTQFALGNHDVTDFLLEQVENGYKMSVSFDTRHDAYIVSMTGKTCISENVGKCLTARADTAARAILSLWYKYDTYCFDGVFPGSQLDSDPYGWG